MFINSLLYFVGWSLALGFAANGNSLLALLGSFSAFMLQIFLDFKKNFTDRWAVVLLAIYATALGYLLELSLINFNILKYTNSLYAVFPPFWVISLYPLFSTTINKSLKKLSSSKINPLLFGTLAPFSYFTAERLGICQFLNGRLIAYFAIASLWIILLYILVETNRILQKINQRIDLLHSDGHHVSMLYDGECPLCSREVCQLKQSLGAESIDFVDIAAPTYQPTAHQNINYDKAMKKLYAIEDNGSIKTGCDAFFIIYAKAGWRGLALLFEAPIFKQVIQFAYKLFARYRLFLTKR